MKVILFSDWHIGITKESAIRKQLAEMVECKPDLLINAGDNTGTASGYKCTRQIAGWVREYFPETPVLWTNGNHDYWCGRSRGGSKPRLWQFNQNIEKIKECLASHKIHYLDGDGLYIHPQHPDVIFLGVSGWYSHPRPRTNDQNYLPEGLGGDTNAFLLRRSEEALQGQLEALDRERDSMPDLPTVVFVSHFPVINTGPDYKGAFEEFCWSESLAEMLRKDYGVRHFLCGHAHQLHAGPLRYEAGSDYYSPKYLEIAI